MSLPPPIIREHEGIKVLRDDYLAGGTKRRFLDQFIREGVGEIVYASPAYGGAQIAVAHAARVAGIKATIFVALRKSPHARTLEAKAAGATIVQVPSGYLTNVQSKAEAYSRAAGAQLLPFGFKLPHAFAAIARVAAEVYERAGPFDEIWSAAGSGCLIHGIQVGISGPKFHAVQIGRALAREDIADAELHIYPRKFEQDANSVPPFPSCSNYDAKAWEICRAKSKGRVLFWNVMGNGSPTVD